MYKEKEPSNDIETTACRVLEYKLSSTEGRFFKAIYLHNYLLLIRDKFLYFTHLFFEIIVIRIISYKYHNLYGIRQLFYSTFKLFLYYYT